MNTILFLIVIVGANIIQGITGFAGTLLAMPPSLLLVGYSVAKPVLNTLGFLSGWYVFLGNVKSVVWREVVKIVCIMAIGMFVGILIKNYFVGREQILYKILGVFVIFLGIHGLLFPEAKQTASKADNLLLPAAGIVHGMFVSGGSLLIGYATHRLHDKTAFRATLSTVWIFLNGLLLLEEIQSGIWNFELFKTLLITIPFLFAGMFIGSKLVARMSQKLFMKITYILLIISGITLLIK